LDKSGRKPDNWIIESGCYGCGVIQKHLNQSGAAVGSRSRSQSTKKIAGDRNNCAGAVQRPTSRGAQTKKRADARKIEKTGGQVSYGPVVFAGVKECPLAGEGVHRWCYYAYKTLRERKVSHEDAINYLHENATRRLEAGDLPADAKCTSIVGSRPIPKLDPSLLERFASRLERFDTADLCKRSPFEPGNLTPGVILRHLYRPGEKVLLFSKCESQGQHLWTCPNKEDSLDEHLFDEFLRPLNGKGMWLLGNPVTGAYTHLKRLETASNPKGRTRRTAECLTSVRYCVLESDSVPEDLWIRVLAQLPLPIAAITRSGGKSVHALIDTGVSEVKDWHVVAERLARLVAPLGGDPSTLNHPAQLTRMPGFYRANTGKWQELLYLNPKPDRTPIHKRLERRNP